MTTEGTPVGRGAHFPVTLCCRSESVNLQRNGSWSFGSAPWKHTPWPTTEPAGNRAEQFISPLGSWFLQDKCHVFQSPRASQGDGSLSSKSSRKKPTGTLVGASWELSPYLHQGCFTCWRGNDGPALICDHTSFLDSWQAAGTGAHFTETEQSRWGSALLL